MKDRLKKKMKKGLKWVIAGVVVVILAFVITFLFYRSKASLYMDGDGASMTIIGGADGPTSVFMAGKLGGNDEEQTQESIVDESEVK